MNPWWKAFAPRIARMLVDAPWTRSGLEEALESFAHRHDVDSLVTRLLNLMPSAPLDTAGAQSLLQGMPVLPTVLLPPRPKPPAWHFEVPHYGSNVELARSLDVTPWELEWFADLGGWLRTKPYPLQHYRTRTIDKRDGHRLLEVPKPRLREMQRRLLTRILNTIPPHDAAHGFVSGRSAVSFARPHERSDVVVRMDLSDFFTSIGRPRVVALFVAVGYPRAVARTLAGICSTETPATRLAGLPHDRATALRAPHLPQGAPTSPALANLVARRLDRRLAGFARKNGLVYTRYADDLAFSGTADTRVDRLIAIVTTIVRAEGFSVNVAKTSIRRSHRRQVLAGLVVNQRAAVPRPRYDEIRALLHNASTTGAAQQNRDGLPDFRAHVYGVIAWIGESSDIRRRKLLEMAERVDWSA
ncbi:reverse transcriptase family protein [Actinomycetes bacterium M1A6_2h]